MRGLKEVGRVLGVNYGTARKYASGRYATFPDPVVPGVPGSPAEWESEDLLAWQASRPGKGGGQHHKKFKEKASNS